MRNTLSGLTLIFAILLGLTAQAHAQSLTASPNPCILAQGQTMCTSRISWSVSNITQPTAEVWVAENASPPVLMACGLSGSVDAPWIKQGSTYSFKLYPASNCTATAALGSLLASVTVTAGSAVPQPPASSYSVGVNYHATNADFINNSFLRRYHDPAVRATVRSQLQSMADAGAKVIHTMIWFTDSPANPVNENWRFSFPPTAQETSNLKQYIQDVSAVRASDGHYLELDIPMAWLGCADYVDQKFWPGCNMNWTTFVSNVKTTVDKVLAAGASVLRPDGQKVLKRVYLEKEVMIGAKANQEQFLKDLYPSFVAKAAAAGVTPSLTFQAEHLEGNIMDDNFIDSAYPVLNKHKSLYYVYRSIDFLRNNNLPVPGRLEFSSYIFPETRPAADLVKRVMSDCSAVFPGMPVAVSETTYPQDPAKRRELGQAFANEFAARGIPEETVFWSTPDSGGQGIHAGFPFDFAAYLPTTGSDTTAPSVSITAPASGATVSGAVSVTASASDNTGVSRVEFYVDGALKNTDTASPYAFSLDTTLLSNGGHALMAKAYDAAGNIGNSVVVSVTVSNAAPPPQGPSGTITASPNPCAPAQGQTMCTSNISWSVSNITQPTAEIWVTEDALAPALMTCGLSGSIDAPWIRQGHTYVFKLYPASNCTATASLGSLLVSVTVTAGGAASTDITPPSVSITAPANGAAVSGAVSVTASASDNVGVSRVEFYVDGALKNTDTASPYAFSLDATLLSNGGHALMAKAYDAAGNIGNSVAVNVTVSNTVPLSPQPVIIQQASPVASSAQAGQSFLLTYNWQGGPTAKSLTAFVHFTDSAGSTILFQDDHIPPTPTNQWIGGSVSYSRTIPVPPGIGAGTYKIMAGLYDEFGTKERLSLSQGAGITTSGDLRYQIGTLVVTSAAAPSHLEFYGLYNMPYSVPPQTYIAETASWSNTAFLFPDNATPSTFNLLRQNKMKASIELGQGIFVQCSTGLCLRADYLAWWNNFITNSGIASNLDVVGFFNIVDEPTWNGVSYADLKTVSDLVKARFPSVRTFIVEAVPKLSQLQVPVSIDIIGFDQYYIRDPRTDAGYQSNYALLKSRRSASQKIIVIMDSWWAADRHGSNGLTQSDMASVASNYYEFAKSDPDVVGIGAFIWSTFAEGTGLRDLPAGVVDEHRRIARLITGKTGGTGDTTAPSVSITASPNPCAPAQGQTMCTSNISWSVSNITQPTAEIWVAEDALAPALMTCGLSGSIDAPWIRQGHTYVFKLYPASNCTATASLESLLASVTVTASSSGQVQSMIVTSTGATLNSPLASVAFPAAAVQEPLQVVIANELMDTSAEIAKRSAAAASLNLDPVSAGVILDPRGTTLTAPMTVTMPLNSGFSFAANNGSPASIYAWNPGMQSWEPLSSTINPSNGMITAQASYLTVFKGFSPAAATKAQDISVFVFPNPAKNGKHPTIHVETGQAEKVEIKIMNLAGWLMDKVTLTGAPSTVDRGEGPRLAYEYVWAKDKSSGVYFYVVTVFKEGKTVKTGKFAVLR